MTTDVVLAELSKGYVPPNTDKNTAWAVRVLCEWQKSREARSCSVLDILQKLYDCECISNAWPLFVLEVRKNDGNMYPAKTIYQILCGILCFMRKRDPFLPNFLDQKDGHFRRLQGTCETVFWQLRQSGVGAHPKKTPVISQDKENILWESGVLGCSTPKSLQHSVFYYLCKNFCLRGGKEQRQLKPSQLICRRDPDHYVYVETGSKK